MNRRGLAIASLIALVATLLVWSRSFFRHDTINYFSPSNTLCRIATDANVLRFTILTEHSERRVRLTVTVGNSTAPEKSYLDSMNVNAGLSYSRSCRFPDEPTLASIFARGRPPNRGVTLTWEESQLLPFMAPVHQFLGFGWGSYNLFICVARVVQVPIWFIVGAFATLPSLSAFGYMRRRQRQISNQCVACGYDLRASPGRCPECGAPTPRFQSDSRHPV